jgi:hypothetical protein
MSGPGSRNRRLTGRAHTLRVLDETVTTDELLEAWRDASRAADLAERLATMAAETADRAELNAEEAAAVAAMAERAAESAAAAAQRARTSADQANELALSARKESQESAQPTLARTRALEREARDAYHSAEAGAPARRSGDGVDGV